MSDQWSDIRHGENAALCKNNHQTDGETHQTVEQKKRKETGIRQIEMLDHVRTDVRLTDKCQTMHGQLSD